MTVDPLRQRVLRFMNQAARDRDELYRAFALINCDYTTLEAGEDDEALARLAIVEGELGAMVRDGVIEMREDPEGDRRSDLFGPPGGSW